MKNTVKRFAFSMDEDTYIELKEICTYKEIPMARAINAILRGYLNSRKEKHDKHSSISRKAN